MSAQAPIAAKSPSGASGLPPGPKGRFVVGNALQFSRDWMGFITRSARQYGDVVYYRIFRTPICLVNRPDLIETVLVTNDRNFTKSRDYRAMRRVLGDGLLTSEGNLWKRQRRLIQPAFHRARIMGYADVMTACAERMLASWKDGEERDVHSDMMQLTLEIVAKTLFGAEISGDAGGIGLALGTFVHEFVRMANLSFLLPEQIPVPGNGKLRAAVARLDEIIYAMIAERRASRQRPGDLLDMLLEARDEEDRGMSDRQLRDEAVTLFLAGHETTALALSWTWFLLARHPEIASRLQEELDRVLAGRAPTAEDLPQLRYADMVIRESMRLYPPAWGIGRQAIEPFEIGGYRLPAKTNVFVSQWITHRDPRFFPDPTRFDPERWRDDPVRSGALPRFAYFPFGGGPRVCIGASFATMEAVLLLASIASKYQMTLVPGHRVEILPTITLRPKRGIRVRLGRRA